jgi:hypothetical protein
MFLGVYFSQNVGGTMSSKNYVSHPIRQPHRAGTTKRNVLIEDVVRNVERPKAGNLVERKSDRKQFVVTAVTAYGLSLHGEVGHFAMNGFTVVG